LIIGVFGLLSVGNLKQELIPSIEIPSAAIVTAYAGASPEVVDSQVSVLIENAVIGLEGLESTTVTSSTGLSLLRVSFEFGTSTSEATERLNNAISAVESSLPADVTPQVISGSFDSVPIIVLAISANNGDNETLSAELDKIAPSIFRQVDGIRDIAVSGGKQKRLNLELNQVALAQNGFSQRDISAALRANGLVLPVGSLTDADGSISIQMGNAVDTVSMVEALPLIPATPNPAAVGVVTIGDVAKVTYEDAPITSIARTNGNETLAISITKTPDGNSVDVSQGIQDLIPDLKSALATDVTVVTIFDQAPFIEESIKDLTVEGLLGLGFAIIVILIFLLSFKSTIITAISIPTSLLVTFIALEFADYSLNLLTLGALTIAIGRVVDDSIVVIENINRHLSYGEERVKAVLSGVKEVALAITSSTLATVAVFLPIALVSGLVGELFRPFAFTVAIALLASLLVSLTIVPVLAYWFLRMPKRLLAAQAADPVGFEVNQREIEEQREKKSLLQRGYIPILNGTKNHPWVTLTAAVLILGYTLSLVPQLKTNFIDGGGSNQFNAQLSMPSNATLEEQDKASADLENQIMAIDGVEVVQSTIGSSGADGRVAFGGAASGIRLTVTAEDDADVDVIQTEVLQLEAPDGSEITVSTGGGFGSSETIDIQVLASDPALLQESVNTLVSGLADVQNVSSITTTLDADQRVLEVIVDREKAASYLLTETTVTGIVASQLRPSAIGTVSIEDKDADVYISGAQAPESIDEIKALSIPTFQGVVKLDSIATVTEVLKPTSITSERGNRTATVSLAPIGEDLGAISAEITAALALIELPAGAEATVGGAAADQAESFSQLGTALLAAVAIVYIVMVATFGSLIQPLLLLVSIPFAAIGALGLLLITDTALGVPALIGMLLLVGLVVTNAIVLLDLVNQYRKKGRSVEDSLIAGARQRLRPILMTAFATIFALTPLALGVTGNSGFISKPLAIVVIGGLVSSTLLTLILVPVLYWLVEGRKERKVIRVNRRLGKKEARSAKKATSGKGAIAASGTAPTASATVMTDTLPNPETVREAAQVVNPDQELAVPEVTEEQAAEKTFQPATASSAPELAWTEEPIEVELDDESSMKWDESQVPVEPTPAVTGLAAEMPATKEENAAAPVTKKEIKAAKKKVKQDRKDQIKAAKNPRHSND
jgi:HAE1 family hydrophobic/amphiphilic exporter-1